LQTLLSFDEMPKNLDATDGLAAAVCHFFQNKNIVGGKRSSAGGWKNFLTENPERLVKR
jgi:crossover junction endodeoxyribonuclease RuvC